MAKIEVGKEILVGLCAALGACVLALAFLLGRASARGPKAAAPPPVQASAPAPPGAASPSPAPVLPPAAHGPAAPPGPPAPVPPPAPPAPAPDPARAAVAAYFRALDRVQPGPLSGDPEALARGLVEALFKGDPSGFDGMLRQAESSRAALAAVDPPAPCAAFHQESLAFLDDSLALLRSIRESLTVPGASAPDVAAQATGLQARAGQLQREEKELRQRYGAGR